MLLHAEYLGDHAFIEAQFDHIVAFGQTIALQVVIAVVDAWQVAHDAAHSVDHLDVADGFVGSHADAHLIGGRVGGQGSLNGSRRKRFFGTHDGVNTRLDAEGVTSAGRKETDGGIDVCGSGFEEN